MNFIRQISIDNKTLDFKFLRIYTSNGYKYYITVEDSQANPYLFHMELKQDRWKIVDAPKVPEWIHLVESQLEAAILEDQMNADQ